VTQAVSRFANPVIESGVVFDVNVKNYSVTVVSQNSERRWLNIPVMSSYLHYTAGEGLFAMPEAGATCWICQSSEFDAQAFILGFGVAWNEEGSYKSGRRPMNPGDIYMGTRDGNSVFVRRGGVIQIQATPLAQRMYIPINNIIRDLCESYHLRTFSGDFLWEVDRDETTTDGERPTRVKLFAKQQADDPSPLAELTLGHHGDDDGDSGFSLKVYDNGEDERTVQVELDITKEGGVSWVLKKSWTLTAEEEISLQAKKVLTLESTDESIKLKAKQNVETDSQNFKVKAGGIELGANGAALSATIEKSTGVLASLNLAGGGSPVVMGTELLAALQPLLTVLGSYAPTSPASVAALISAANAVPAALQNALSSKVYVGK